MRSHNGALAAIVAWCLAGLLAGGCQEATDFANAICTEGVLSCPCHSDGTCDDNAYGVPLTCTGGRCLCTAGTTGCLCQKGECMAGSVCSDAGGGVMTCQPKGYCPRGTDGCPCYQDASCDEDPDGVAMQCTGGVCGRAGCEPGAHQCPCLPAYQCADKGDVCWSGLCVADSGQVLIPPKDPKCYTPCRDGLETTAGTFIPCDVDGLLPTCVGDSTCVSGSCLSPEERDLGWKVSTACTFDSQCPDFQACVQGQCYSTCAVDEDCRLGRECHRKACRRRCTGIGNECDEGEFCRTEDGQSGFCMPLVARKSDKAPAGALAQVVAKRSKFTVVVPSGPTGSGTTLQLSDAQKIGTIDVTNTGDRSVTLTITPTEHTTFPSSGPVTIRAPDEAAIPWATFTATVGDTEQSSATSGKSATLTLEPQQVGQVIVSRKQGSELVAPAPADPTLDAYNRWEGRLAIEADDGARQEVRLSFARSPAGRWAGEVTYFADFGDLGVDAWVAAGRPGAAAATYLGNAFIQKWVAVREGAISLAEFRQILRATEEESWQSPLLQAKCPTQQEPLAHHACYPTAFGNGVGHYSSDTSLWPVPSGATSMPFAAYLDAGTTATSMQGAVDSSETLHYAGSPTMTVQFTGDPSACPPGACIIGIDQMELQSYVGGRRLAVDGACTGSYEAVQMPWYVPLFEEGTAIDPTDGSRFKLWCRDASWPLTGSKDKPKNLSISGANPIPDGRTLERKLVLIDGAILDQKEIFAIVREEIPSFVPSCVPSSSAACKNAPEDKLVRYGYLLLTRSEDGDATTVKTAPAPAIENPTVPAPTCSEEMIHKVFEDAEGLDGLTPRQRAILGVAMVTGTVPPDDGDAVSAESAHYLCPSTDRFDGPCPAPELTQVTFFVAPVLAGLQSHACGNEQCDAGEPCTVAHCGPPCAPGEGCVSHPVADCAVGCDAGKVCRACTPGGSCTTADEVGACAAQLDTWAASSTLDITVGPACHCGTSLAPCDSACGNNYSDLRLDRKFYAVPGLTLPAGGGPTQVDGVTLWPHYLCHETGRIDMGPGGVTACPQTSALTWFFIAKNDAAVRALPCQSEQGTCLAGEACSVAVPNLDGTSTNADCAVGAKCASKGTCLAYVDGLKVEPLDTHFQEVSGWSCADPNTTVCTWPEAPEVDLRKNKKFYTPQAPRVVFNSFDNDLQDAFRYKTRFRTRAGANIGFAPDACVDGATPIPYCYDAPAIESLRHRVDCAAAIFTRHYEALTKPERATLRKLLVQAYSAREELVPGELFPVSHPGFEQLNAELLVMLGDEAVTAAFASRFDVSGDKIAEFKGSKLEPNGINLAGKPGFEMYGLYLGVQYYDLVLERFFGQAAVIGESLDLIDGNPEAGDGPPAGESFLDFHAASTYLPRVARASTRKAEALAEIASRYDGFNRDDLARLVAERAYLSTYLESVVVLQLMDRLALAASPQERDGIRKEKLTRQVEYESALRKLRSLYDGFTPEKTFFGVPATFVPIPPMDTLDTNYLAVNTFDVAFAAAMEAYEVSAESEQIALKEKREFDTDKEKFKSALYDLTDQSEGDLGEICGTFIGDDGGVYTATIANKDASALTRGMDDPCGLVGTGELHDAIGDLEGKIVAAKQVRLTMANTSQAVKDLIARMNAQCARIGELKDDLAEIAKTTADLETGLAVTGAIVATMDRTIGLMDQFREATSCEPPTPVPPAPGTCTTSLAGVATFVAVSVGLGIAASVTDITAQATFGAELGKQQVKQVTVETLAECEALKIDTKFDVADKLRELEEIKLDATTAEIELRRQTDVIRGLRNDVANMLAGAETTQQNLINVEAAHNDPNVRIFKNAAIKTADKHFKRALTFAYRATRVFEYYTSQSYAAKDDLTLIRLASVGENTLQNYLLDLSDAFTDFEYAHGQPDLRLLIVSLRDDIVPQMEANKAMTLEQRKTAFHKALTEVARRDDRGWITLPFSTSLKQTSPITANHKVLYMEAELSGRDLGDALGRVYVRQLGTGTIKEVGDELASHVFPPATTVINTIFNGRRGSETLRFDEQLYRSWRLRDRALVNTQWQLILNTRDELVNQDIDLDGLQDIVLYVYYTDFTTLDTLQ